MNLIIDTNIFIAALLREGRIRELIVNSPYSLLLPEVIYEEIIEHKQELIDKSGLTEEEFNSLSAILCQYVTIVPTSRISQYKEEAMNIIGTIDPDDALFFATALAFESCAIWSDDVHLKKQDKIKVISTRELIEVLGDED